MRGTVTAFDEARGIGEVEAAGSVRYPFHCTRIADGTRRIPVGATVEFRVVAGPGGRWEASDLVVEPSA